MVDKIRRLGIGLAIMLVIAVIGFSAYRAFTGESSISQTVVFAFLGLTALGLVRAFIASGEQKLTVEDFLFVIILIGMPIVVLIECLPDR